MMLSACLLWGSAAMGQSLQRENGWYDILDGRKDSIAKVPIVTVKDFVALRLDSAVFQGRMQFQISGTIGEHKRGKWADATEKAVGKRIGFVFNNKVITNPQVNMRIESGRFAISAPQGDNLKQLYREILQEKVDSIESLFAGWDKDSLYYALSRYEKDSCIMAMDYWEAAEWKDISTNPLDHYWYGELDTTEYARLERKLEEELRKYKLSSSAADYMTSSVYKDYKSFISAHPDYINLMFQGFLFQESPKGLYGYLIDDIITYRYPEAPSIREAVKSTDNSDDEAFAVLKYQKGIWRLMNREREKKKEEVDTVSSSTDEPHRLDSKKLWEEANKYRASVTDTTFLQTQGAMSDQAIDALTPDGWNNNYAFNQVVYLKALERVRKYLSLKDNQLVCNLKFGKDIRIAEDLYAYILTLFDDWNKWVKEGRCRIVKDEEGVYEVVPVRQGR